MKNLFIYLGLIVLGCDTNKPLKNFNALQNIYSTEIIELRDQLEKELGSVVIVNKGELNTDQIEVLNDDSTTLFSYVFIPKNVSEKWKTKYLEICKTKSCLIPETVNIPFSYKKFFLKPSCGSPILCEGEGNLIKKFFLVLEKNGAEKSKWVIFQLDSVSYR
jgi:hypothetical protein